MSYHLVMSKLAGRSRPHVVFLMLIALLAPAMSGDLPDETEAPAAPPGVVLEKVLVEPTGAGPETLCRLRVVLHNRGSAMASLFAFEVLLDGVPIPSYAGDLFVLALPPGERTELALFNFWSSESGREPPADGTLEVEVRLLEARWYAVDEPSDEGGAPPLETWRPQGEVGGLPSVARTVLEIPLRTGSAEGEPVEDTSGESGVD